MNLNNIFTKNYFLFIPFCFLIILIQTDTIFAQSEILEKHANEFTTVDDFDSLIDEISSQRLVLMGEATHGTNAFYKWRAELSKRLIQDKGYSFIAVEADWPALSRINEFIKHKENAPSSIEEAMGYIERWPLWMWRNSEIKNLVSWLHDYNRELKPENRVGFYGVDLYAKRASMQQVIHYFSEMNNNLAQRSERAYSCLTRFPEIRDYLQMVARSGENCSEELDEVLEWVRENEEVASNAWEYFNAEQNAKMIINAERHYRGNLEPGAASWNYRASHFYLTAERLLNFYGDGSKGIVWAHNTHIGDARATDMARQGAVNIGQLARETIGHDNVYAIGFGTYTGNVLAARQWEGQMENMAIPPARDNSWEATLEATGFRQFYLLLNNEELKSALQSPVPHRAIGVTYQPEQESRGNYVNTIIPDRYDAFIFIRETDVLDTLD
ncbi:MAG: erythromycin esterase family protein [Balneolaceae bacterium]